MEVMFIYAYLVSFLFLLILYQNTKEACDLPLRLVSILSSHFPNVCILLHFQIVSPLSNSRLESVNLALSEIIQSNPKPNLCVASFISKAITAQLMTTCVETILMIRGAHISACPSPDAQTDPIQLVHALYNCSWRIGLFLVLVMLIGTSMEIMGSTMSISKLEPGPKGTICIPKRSSVETLLPYA